jgi:hypothetical protein
LGNGWIDARVQGPAVIDYAYWHGMIDSATFRAMHAEWENCKDGSPQNPPFHDFTVPDECGIMAQVLLAGMYQTEEARKRKHTSNLDFSLFSSNDP